MFPLLLSELSHSARLSLPLSSIPAVALTGARRSVGLTPAISVMSGTCVVSPPVVQYARRGHHLSLSLLASPCALSASNCSFACRERERKITCDCHRARVACRGVPGSGALAQRSQPFPSPAHRLACVLAGALCICLFEVMLDRSGVYLFYFCRVALNCEVRLFFCLDVQVCGVQLPA